MTSYIYRELLKIYGNAKRKRAWSKLHPGSDTIPMNDFNFNNVSIGYGTYGELNIVDFGGDKKLVIKNYVSIAQHVTFILNAEHYADHISTYPFKVKVLQIAQEESFGKGDIMVDDDVWIGYGATILSNIHIGQGAIIAAGAMVTKDVPPYAIVGGNPARIIKYRFSDDMIKELLKIDYSKLTKVEIEKHINDLYVSLSDKKQIEWLKKL